MKSVSPLALKTVEGWEIPLGQPWMERGRTFRPKCLRALGLREDRQNSLSPLRWIFLLSNGQSWAVLPSQLTQTLERRGRDRGGTCLGIATHARHVGGLTTFRGQPPCYKTIPHTAEKVRTWKTWRCSVFVEKKTIWVSQTYNVPQADASRAVILPLWRQQLKVPSFRELSISFVFLSTFNALETQ